ncbi:RNA polymerase II transcription factor B subunit 4, partial [Coemansia sp. RSA 1752]
MAEPQESDSSLLVVVLDVNASAWARSPLSLDKAVQQMVIFINAYLALNSENRLVVIGANHKECRYLFPSDPSSIPPVHDIQVYEQFRVVDVKVLSGVHEMIASEMDDEDQQSLISRALSMSLCHIHRVSESSISKIWSRILVLSAGQDSPHSYIPLMNSIFAAQKMSVLIDICKVYGPDSVFLQQAAEITGGNYLKVDTNNEASLLQTLMFTCLPDQYTRGILNAPGNELIDFRATAMIFVFLIDTSVSMGQGLSSTVSSKSKDEQANESLFGDNGRVNRRWQRKAVQGGTRTHTSTRIECAKSIVEQIVTHRHSYEHDRYMLVTYSATGRGCIRSTLRDSRQSMLAELRRVEATDRFYGGVALTTLFDQLALTRAAYDMDTYGYGRYPTLNEQTRIVWLTDGASIVTSSGVQNKLNLPVNNTPWVESYVEPFRWDQRMVMVLLHEQGDKELCNGKKNSSESALLPMCMVMGGSVHHVGSMHQAQRFVEGFAPSRAMLGQGRPQGSAMANSGVLVNFERIDDNPANPGNSDLRVLLHATPCNVMNGPLPPLGADTGLGVNAGRPAGNSAG